MATLSTAPEVGIDLATPFNGPFLVKLLIKSALFVMAAKESLGETNILGPKMIFLSASPSQAAPKSGTFFDKSFLKTSIFASRSLAWTKFGSGWIPPKSGSGLHLSKFSLGTPKIFWKIAIA